MDGILRQPRPRRPTRMAGGWSSDIDRHAPYAQTPTRLSQVGLMMAPSLAGPWTRCPWLNPVQTEPYRLGIRMVLLLYFVCFAPRPRISKSPRASRTRLSPGPPTGRCLWDKMNFAGDDYCFVPLRRSVASTYVAVYDALMPDQIHEHQVSVVLEHPMSALFMSCVMHRHRSRVCAGCCRHYSIDGWRALVPSTVRLGITVANNNTGI